MRLEIITPDGTRPDLKARLVNLIRRLSEKPELVEQIDLGKDEDEAIQKMFTPERLAHIAKAKAEVGAGIFYTSEQVREHFVQKQKAWTKTDPR